MVAARSLAPYGTAKAPDEQRMLLHGVSWKEYVLLRDVLDGPGVRMTYLCGALELMSPSPDHELWKKNIARLIELYAHLRRIDLRAYGSTTFKREAKERGAEPDECYLIGRRLTDYPEIVLEVVHTAPLVNKLDVYAGMGIAEVWIYQSGTLTVHALDATTTTYEARAESALLPGLDLPTVARYAAREDTAQALREFEAELAGASP